MHHRAIILRLVESSHNSGSINYTFAVILIGFEKVPGSCSFLGFSIIVPSWSVVTAGIARMTGPLLMSASVLPSSLSYPDGFLLLELKGKEEG